MEIFKILLSILEDFLYDCDDNYDISNMKHLFSHLARFNSEETSKWSQI